MQYRKFGQTDLRVSETGFGAWAIGGGAKIGETAIGWGDADDDLSIAALRRAREQGINFFDTADIYGLGHSEDLLGSVFGNDPAVIIATKGGNVDDNGVFSVNYTKAHLLRACEASLRRLRREYIDYYQLHTARLAHLEQGDCIEAMQQLQQEGKIRYWGLSLNTFDPAPEAQWLMERKLGSGFQLVFNIINQRALELIHQAAANGYGLIARMPLQFGLLTGKFDQGFAFPDHDHRKKRLTADVIEATKKTLLPLLPLRAKYNCSLAALAMGYILSYPEISVMIPGMRSPQQVDENTMPVPALTEEDKKLIEAEGRSGLSDLLQLIFTKG